MSPSSKIETILVTVMDQKYFDIENKVYRISENGDINIFDLPFGSYIYDAKTHVAGMDCLRCGIWEGKLEFEKHIIISFYVWENNGAS